MIRIIINGEDRQLNDSDVEQWVNQHINIRRREGVDNCVRVKIIKGDVNMTLTTPHCTSTGGGRLPRPKESEIFELWDKRGLNKSDFSSGNLIAFLKQLENLI
jgi:hypothetical protein